MSRAAPPRCGAPGIVGAVALDGLGVRDPLSLGGVGASGVRDGVSAMSSRGDGDGGGATRRSSTPAALSVIGGAAGLACRSGSLAGEVRAGARCCSTRRSPSRWSRVCAAVEGVSCASIRSPVGLLSRAESVVPLAAGGGVTGPGGRWARRSPSRWSRVCAAVEGVSCASIRSPVGLLSRAESVVPLAAGGGVTGPGGRWARRSPSRWSRVCAVMECVSCASRSPPCSLGRANSVGPLGSRGDGGVTALGAFSAGVNAGRLSPGRCSETGATLWGVMLQSIEETLRRIGIARIAQAAMDAGTAADRTRSRTARTA